MFLLERLEDQFRTKSESVARDLTSEARKQWYTHPLTQELVTGLKADLLAMFMQWGDGHHMKESVEQTALENAKLLALYQSVSDVVEKIEEIRDREDDEQRPEQNSE